MSEMNASSFHDSFPFWPPSEEADDELEGEPAFNGHHSFSSFEDTLMFSTPVLSADNLTHTTPETREFMCKARGKLGNNHADAVLSVPRGTRHGAVIYCSDPICVASGRAFRWCNVCEVLAARRNFGQRHGHGQSVAASYRASRVEQYQQLVQEHAAAPVTATNHDNDAQKLEQARVDPDNIDSNRMVVKSIQCSQGEQNLQNSLLCAQRMNLRKPPKNITPQGSSRTSQQEQHEHKAVQQYLQRMQFCGAVDSSQNAFARPSSPQSSTGSSKSMMSFGLDQLGDIDHIFDSD